MIEFSMQPNQNPAMVPDLSGKKFLTNQVDYLQFNTTATPQPNAEGLLQWNATDETLDLGMPDDITLQIGQETQIKARNATGSTILNGKAVYVSGVLGNRPTITLAQGNAHSTGHIIGITTQDILNNDDGKVTTQGYVRNIDTTGTPYGETWAEGDMLWVSKTIAGGLTNTEPAVPHHSAQVGVVTRAHITQGAILVNISQHKQLERLSDVNGTPLTETGQVPNWNDSSKYFDFDRNIERKNYVDVSTISPTFTYSSGKLSNITYANGVEKDFTYNGDGTLNTITVTYPDRTITKTLVWSSGVLQSINIV